MKTCVMVVAHKSFEDSVLQRNWGGYKVIKVGKGMSDSDAKQRGWLCDDIGENIADENPFYCELTALYWAWKNLNADIVGLVHYRRFFVNYKADSKQLADDILSTDDIEQILQKKKIILPFPNIKVRNCSMLYRNKPKDNQDKHWVILEEIISESYPNYIEAFNHVLYDCLTTYYLNMFITTHQLLNDYCTWLFDVLKKYDEKIAARGEQRIPRVDGFLSETLLHVWVEYRFQKHEICWMPHLQTTDHTAVYYSKTFKNMLVRWFNSWRPYYFVARRGKIILLVLRRVLLNK